MRQHLETERATHGVVHLATGSSPIVVRRSLRILILTVAVVILALNLYAPADPTVTQRVLASLLILLGIVPIYSWLRGKERWKPFMMFFGGIYVVYYALPIFLLEKYSRAYYLTQVISDEFLTEALFFALIGLAALFIGYYGFHQRFLSKLLPNVTMHWQGYKRVKPIGVVFGIFGILAYYVKLLLDVPLVLQQLLDFMGDLSLISIAILFALQLQGRLGIFGKTFLWAALVLSRFMLGVGSGATWQGILVVLLLLYTYTIVRYRFPLTAIAFGFVAVILLRPMQIEFRELTWSGELAQSSPLQKTVLFAEMAGQHLTGGALFYADSFEISISRLAHLMTFAEVVGATPASVPYWMGETYYPLLFKPIPRFLWPEKPISETGQTFGHRYNFLDPSDFVTSYNLPQLVEFYVNFGPMGVIAGMLLLGTLYRLLLGMFVHDRMGLGNVISAAYLANSLLLIESGLEMVLGGVLWGLVFLAIIHQTMKVAEAVQ